MLSDATAGLASGSRRPGRAPGSRCPGFVNHAAKSLQHNVIALPVSWFMHARKAALPRLFEARTSVISRLMISASLKPCCLGYRTADPWMIHEALLDQCAVTCHSLHTTMLVLAVLRLQRISTARKYCG